MKGGTRSPFFEPDEGREHFPSGLPDEGRVLSATDARRGWRAFEAELPGLTQPDSQSCTWRAETRAEIAMDDRVKSDSSTPKSDLLEHDFWVVWGGWLKKLMNGYWKCSFIAPLLQILAD